MYYSKSAALREHVNTLAAVLIQYKSKNLSDLEYTRKISCMVTEAYRLRRRNNGKPFVPATVAEWMNMYLNGPSVCKYYKKEPNQIYVPIKINTGYRDAITTLTMVLETIMGTNTASEYFNATDAIEKIRDVGSANKQLFDMLTHTKLTDKLNIKTAFDIKNFEDLKDYDKVFDAVLPKVIALETSSGTVVSIVKAGNSDLGTARSDVMTFNQSDKSSPINEIYTPLFALDSANSCNIINIKKDGSNLINLHPFLIGGDVQNIYYIMNSAIYKDDQYRLHTLQSVYVAENTEFLYMLDGKTLLAGKDLDKLKIVEGYFCYDKEEYITDAYIIEDQTLTKTLEFLLLGNTDRTSSQVILLNNFEPGMTAEKIKEYTGMIALTNAITLKKNRNATEATTSASRGLDYLNRLIKIVTFNKVKENIAKVRDARVKYLDYVAIGVTIAYIIAEQGIAEAGFSSRAALSAAFVPRLIMGAITVGSLYAINAFKKYQTEQYAKNLLENL